MFWLRNKKIIQLHTYLEVLAWMAESLQNYSIESHSPYTALGRLYLV